MKAKAWNRVVLLLLLCLMSFAISGCWVPVLWVKIIEHVHYPLEEFCSLKITQIVIWVRIAGSDDVCVGLHGFQIPTTWDIAAVDSFSINGDTFAVHEDPTVTSELNSLYPPRPGYKWVGYATNDSIDSSVYPDSTTTRCVFTIDRNLPMGPEAATVYERWGEGCHHRWTEEKEFYASDPVDKRDVMPPLGAVITTDDQWCRPAPTGGLFGTTAQGTDTFYYGGTDIIGGEPYAAVPAAAGWLNRKMWTWSPVGFNGTPHSGLNMDGWEGKDNSVQTEDYFNVKDDGTLGANCVISGVKSLFCGATNQQCVDLCYMDQNGTGYGNSWSQIVATKAYVYDSGEVMTLDYDYSNETEPGYDFTYVILQVYDTGAGEWVDYDTLAEYTGLIGGRETIVVDSYLGGLAPPVDLRILFDFQSGASSSDEDGLVQTTCGGFVVDNYVLDQSVGGGPDAENFEGIAVGALPPGWQKIVAGCGDYAHVKHINDLPIGLDQDPCVGQHGSGWCEVGDSVLVFIDEGDPTYPHPLCQDNFAVSPIIDLSDHLGLPGRFLHRDRFASLPLGDRIFMYWRARYTPGCESGGWTPWLHDNYVYYTAEGTYCRSHDNDLSSFVPPQAEKVQIGLGVINLCYQTSEGLSCTDVCNTTPYFDNVTFGVYGSNVAPYISMRELDFWQDQFAEDGTLNPTSTADTRVAKYLGDFVPPVFGDTLTCRSSVDNMEVWFAFRMAKVGPRQPFTDAFFTSWFPGVTEGTWQEAKMDTAEITTLSGTATWPVRGTWMSTFHESDPRFLFEGTEILPNNLFVPGTRIEYFLKARYVGSSDWFYLPDTTGGACEEFEILPMMRNDGHGGLDWPCLLVADHFGQRGNLGMRNSDRIGRHLTANNFDYDIYSRLGPTSDLRNGIGRWAANTGQIGGPGTPEYNWGSGATLSQILAYTHCMLNTGNVDDFSMYRQDVDLASNWLKQSSADTPKFFLLSGTDTATWLATHWWLCFLEFLNSVLGVKYVCENYAAQENDYTYCLPINSVAGGRLTGGSCPTQYVLRSNGCPSTFDVIAPSAAAGCNAVAEREYDAGWNPGVTSYSAVSNVVSVSGGANYKTLVESYDNCLTRTDNSLGYPACGGDDVLTDCFNCVLTWGGLTPFSICNPSSVNVNPNAVAAPPVASSLAQAYPNPMNPTATIRYTVGVPGKVMLRVFDVTGRVIRTLVDETKGTGAYSVIWDGANDRAERVASGVFFYQLDVPGFRSAKKLVILQ